MAELENLDDDLVIYAAATPSWTPLSPAAAYAPSADGSPSSEAPESGLQYFLEVDLAKEALEVWRLWREGRSPSLDERVEAVIYYATHDAYIPIEG